MIRLLEDNDYDSWIDLAKEVEPLFGPMTDSEEFQAGIKNCIKSKIAYCIENSPGDIAGIIALDKEKNEILWLAVAQKHRGNKYGDQLVKKAIDELYKNGAIYVQTFASGTNEGQSARHIYEKNGFMDLKDGGKNPAGFETVIMVKK